MFYVLRQIRIGFQLLPLISLLAHVIICQTDFNDENCPEFCQCTASPQRSWNCAISVDQNLTKFEHPLTVRKLSLSCHKTKSDNPFQISAKLTEFLTDFNHLSNLTVSDCPLAQEFSVPNSVEWLKLSESTLENKELNLSRLIRDSTQTIRTVVASNTQITSFHVGERIFKNLQYLDLSGNGLSANDMDFRSLENLKILKLDENELRILDLGLVPQSLFRLSVRDNKLGKTIEPKSGSSQYRLTVIDLHGNFLNYFDQSVILPNVKLADFSKNRIDKLPRKAFLGKPNLKFVNLTFNLLRTVPSDSVAINSAAEPPLELELMGNPLNCSCHLEWMNRKFDAKVAASVVVNDMKEIKCWSEYSNKMENVSSLSRQNFLCAYKHYCPDYCSCCKFVTCFCKSHCPMDECRCFYDNFGSNIIKCDGVRNRIFNFQAFPHLATDITLTNNDLHLISQTDFYQKSKLRTLNLTNSKINQIEDGSFAFLELDKLQSIDLSLNQLKNISVAKLFGRQQKAVQGYGNFSLKGNDFSDFDQGTLKIFAEGFKFLWLGNQKSGFKCGCGNNKSKFQKWMEINSEKVVDSNMVLCTNGEAVTSFKCSQNTGSDEGIFGAVSIWRVLFTLLVVFLIILLCLFLLCVLVLCFTKIKKWKKPQPNAANNNPEMHQLTTFAN